MLLLVLFSVLALVLAAVGLYGVLGRRKVRHLSADPATRDDGYCNWDRDRRDYRAGDLTIHLQFALACLRDYPFTYIGSAALLAAIALAAIYIPARRAIRVDPMVALRSE